MSIIKEGMAYTFPPYPIGAIRRCAHLPDILYLVTGTGILQKYTSAQFGRATSKQAWNINSRSINYPGDFAFSNYWHAYAYSLRQRVIYDQAQAQA